jgi:hypothetical protein
VQPLASRDAGPPPAPRLPYSRTSLPHSVQISGPLSSQTCTLRRSRDPWTFKLPISNRRDSEGELCHPGGRSDPGHTVELTADSLLFVEADDDGADGTAQDFLAGGDEAVVKMTQDREPTNDELLMFRALLLLGSGLEQFPTNDWASTFPNDLAGSICLVRAYRQLRAAVQLTVTGYYSEVGVLLRAAYESAGAGRMLAKDPELSSRWLLKQEWFPEKQVRQWITGRIVDKEQARGFATHYRHLSASAHPTAKSCLGMLVPNDDGPRYRLMSEFDPQSLSMAVRMISGTAIFACFALRNGAAGEGALHPEWRRELQEVAEKVLAVALPHLDRDWSEEHNRYTRVVGQVRELSELDSELEHNPGSWRNLKE